jgi:hypothetical protein
MAEVERPGEVVVPLPAGPGTVLPLTGGPQRANQSPDKVGCGHHQAWGRLNGWEGDATEVHGKGPAGGWLEVALRQAACQPAAAKVGRPPDGLRKFWVVSRQTKEVEELGVKILDKAKGGNGRKHLKKEIVIIIK